MAETSDENLDIISYDLYGCSYNQLGCFIKRGRVRDECREMSQNQINKIKENKNEHN